MKQQRWLLGEINTWVAEGLIDPQQAAILRQRYAVASAALPWTRIIFSSIGALLLGLGLILFFAYNWAAMPKFAKLAVVFITLLSAHGAGLWCRESGRFHPALAEGLHLLGTILFGAGIWLVAQIYHLNEHYPTAYLIWGIGALAMGWALPSVGQGIVAGVLIGLWHGSEALDFDTPNHGALLVVLLGMLPLAGWLRSWVLLVMTLVTLYFSLFVSLVLFAEEWLVPITLAFSCLLLALGRLAEDGSWFPESATSLIAMGYLSYFLIVYLLIFPDIVGEVIDPDGNAVALAYLVAFALPALGLWTWRLTSLHAAPRPPPLTTWLDQGMVCGVLVVLLLAILASYSAGDSLRAAILAWFTLILANVALLTHGSLFIVSGSTERRPGLTALGCGLIAAVIITRYLDLFHSLLMRSLAFVVLGAIVFGVGNFYHHQGERQP